MIFTYSTPWLYEVQDSKRFIASNMYKDLLVNDYSDSVHTRSYLSSNIKLNK